MPYRLDQLFDSADELIDFFLGDRRFRTVTKYHANSTGRGGMVFRGQSDARWRLIATAFRPDNKLHLFTPQPPGPIDPDPKTRRRHLGWQLQAEGRAIFIFQESADSVGLPTPIDYTSVRDDLPIKRAAYLDDENFDFSVPYPSASFHRATALAQHSGVPTRFLDWSESPLVACYFAAYGCSSFAEKQPEAEHELAVCYLSAFDWARDESPVQLVQAPRHENAFLRRQEGIFTSVRRANSYFLDHGEWPSLEDLAGDRFHIYRARLKATHADALLRRLYDLGIERHTLMPTLQKAARSYAYARKLFDETDVQAADEQFTSR